MARNAARTTQGSTMYTPGRTFHRWASAAEAFNIIASALQSGQDTSKSRAS